MSIAPEAHASISGLEDAIAAARTEGHAAGKAEGHAAGYASGRADAAAIFSSEEAKGRSGLAAELAGDAAITPERASSLLGKSAKDDTGSYAAALQAATPDAGPNDEPKSSEDEARAGRMASLRNLGKSISARR